MFHVERNLISETRIVWLRTVCSKRGLTLSDGMLDRLASYANLLSHWNGKVNLVSRLDADSIWERHIFHSLSPFFHISIPEGAAILDLGSGGGLPGVPWAIARPDLNVTLLDSIQKKMRAVSSMVEELGIPGVSVLASRAEDLTTDRRYDYVVARGVAPLHDLVHWSRPLLRKGGGAASAGTTSGFDLSGPALIALKGGDLADEIRRAHLSGPPYVVDLCLDTVVDTLTDKKLVIVPVEIL